MSEQTEVHVMPGRNGGTLRRGNPGRRSALSHLQEVARRDLARALTLAREILDDTARPDANRLQAAEFIRRCSGIDKEKPRPRKRATFAIVRQSADELTVAVGEPPRKVTPPLPPG